MAYGIQHTIEVWNDNGTVGKYDVVLHENHYSYAWCSGADQHHTFPRASCTYHVAVFGNPIPRSLAQTFVENAEKGNVVKVKLVQE